MSRFLVKFRSCVGRNSMRAAGGEVLWTPL